MEIWRKAAFAFLFLSLSSGALARDLFEVPPLYLRPYASLSLPTGLSKQDIRQVLQVASGRLFGEAFVDIGDMSDWMHGHVLFAPPHIGVPSKALAVLFHTQEFPQLRSPSTYVYRGRTLDPYARSWLFWLGGANAGEVTPAYLAQPGPITTEPTTVSSDMLDRKVFGEEASAREVTFFFFRFLCEDLDRAGRTAAEVSASNLLELSVGGERVCLALEDDACRSGDDDPGVCRGTVRLAPFRARQAESKLVLK